MVSKPFSEGKPKAITRYPPDEIRFKWTGHTAQSGGIKTYPRTRRVKKTSTEFYMMVRGGFKVSAIGESEGMPYRTFAWSFKKVMGRVMVRLSSGSKILNLLKALDN